MTPVELQQQLDIEKLPLGPNELQAQINAEKAPLGPDGLQAKIDAKATAFKMEEQSFIGKHPNLYGAFGVAQALIPYVKYIDPIERERFAKLSTQKQTRELLLQNLEAVALGVAPVITKGAVPIIAKYLPKTYKALKFIKTPIKAWKGLAGTPAKEVAEAGIERAATKLAPKPIVTPEPQAAQEVIADPIKRITAALKKARPIRKEQEKLYTLERKRRIAKAKAAGEGLTGQARVKAETKALGGEMPKVEFESLKILQEDANEAFNLIKQKIPNFFEQKTAERGLAKLFGEFGGAVPQKSELTKLRKVFPQDFIETLRSKQSLMKQLKELGYEGINVPRAIMASFDLSAPLRQGIFLAPRHPVRFTQAFVKMFKQFGSEKTFRAVQESLSQKKWYNLLREEGLQITERGGELTIREEAFMGANLAEKIPLVGRVVGASNRAHTGFLNKLRVDVADDLVEKAFKAGLDPENNPVLTQAITKFVNAASGRGGLGPFKDAAILLNSILFSPRLMGSRLTLLNPVYYVKQPKFVRREALKSLFAFAGAIGTTLGLADMVPGVKVGKDPRSADFGKIKIRDTRIDVMGGFQQYLRAAGQLISGKYVSSATGKEYTLGEGYKPLTRWGIVGRQVESKLAPVASFVVALLKGRDIAGKKVSVPKEVGKRFIPMALQDIYDIAKEDPELLPLSGLGIFGVGLQTYGPRRSTGKGIKGIGKLETGGR